MRIADSVAELVGKTPLLRAKKYQKDGGVSATILLKVESFNPAGSIKDRVALEMIESAEREGRLQKGATIVEPTSGNTGIGLAALAAAKGYEMIVVMPETMSEERRKLVLAYGAKLVLTDGALGMQGAIDKAEELVKELPNAMMAGQFTNPANPTAHYKTTGPEIWADTDGKVDILVAGVGTGGTISGTGKYLKEKNPAIRVVAVEPSGSPVLSEGRAGKHGLQGIGAGFVPKTLDQTVYDEVISVTEDEAYAEARALARTEGVLVGISSGAALAAAKRVAKRAENAGKNIVVILPDDGGRYLSTTLFDV